VTRGLAVLVLATCGVLYGVCYLLAVAEWDREGWPPSPGGHGP